MPKALITGITGQDGSHLAEFLLAKGYQVFGLVRRSSTEDYPRLEGFRDRVTLVPGDLVDATSLARAVKDIQPNEIYNLAGMSQLTGRHQPGQPAWQTGINASGRVCYGYWKPSPVCADTVLPGIHQRNVWRRARVAAK